MCENFIWYKIYKGRSAEIRKAAGLRGIIWNTKGANKMSKNVIFCYSGTGNCLDMAKNIAKVLGDTDIVMMRRAPAVVDVEDAERVGFVFPCYAGGLPGEVERFVRSLKIAPEAYTFGVGQFAVYPGNGLHIIDEIVGLDYWKSMSHQCGFIQSLPHNLMIPPMTAEMAEKRSQATAEKIGRDVLAKKEMVGRPREYKLNTLEYKAWPFLAEMKSHQFLVDPEKCIHCGQCVKICPKSNITMIAETPCFGNDCYQCVSCLQFCPTGAITMKGIGSRERYHNPNITAEELNKDVIHVD